MRPLVMLIVVVAATVLAGCIVDRSPAPDGGAAVGDALDTAAHVDGFHFEACRGATVGALVSRDAVLPLVPDHLEVREAAPERVRIEVETLVDCVDDAGVRFGWTRALVPIVIPDNSPAAAVAHPSGGRYIIECFTDETVLARVVAASGLPCTSAAIDAPDPLSASIVATMRFATTSRSLDLAIDVVDEATSDRDTEVVYAFWSGNGHDLPRLADVRIVHPALVGGLVPFLEIAGDGPTATMLLRTDTMPSTGFIHHSHSETITVPSLTEP